MVRLLAFLSCVALSALAIAVAATGAIVLPSGWRLTPPQAAVMPLGTMPQGLSLSPDGNRLALVESGVAPAALRIIDVPSMRDRRIPLQGAFGKPVWIDNAYVLVAGANDDALVRVNAASGAVSKTPESNGTWPAAVNIANGTTIVANDGNGTVNIGAATVRAGDHPSDIAVSRDGKTAYVAVRKPSEVLALDIASHRVVATIPVGLHPSALALSGDGTSLYVAESDDDSLGVIDTQSNAVRTHVALGLHTAGLSGYGASPNAIAVHGDDVFVSLGAENAIALIRDGRVLERIPAGWYPTGIAVASDGTLYVTNGKGEGSPANPQFNPFKRNSPGYVGIITTGSLRVIPRTAYDDAAAQTQDVIRNAVPEWTAPPAARTVVRAHGPIAHVIYIIKENRSYDQVLGDIPGADGDANLTYFGKTVTPNQHELAHRFGTFDNAYTDAQVSANGHNWTDAGFANDYVERFWPPNYGDRRDLYDFQTGTEPDVPHQGYIWDAAKRAGITYRDYGEDIDFRHGIKIGLSTFPGLAGHFDPQFIGWDLQTSDGERFTEWQREFKSFIAHGNLPQLEIVYLPNDHTSGTRPGAPTPTAYVAMNDWVVGRLVDAVSHSRYWKSTAIFALEDDAQSGPDHVSAQRSTFYIASAYARGGVQHAHYSTTSFLHTIELLLGLPPLSTYDAVARPLYDAFASSPVNAQPFTATRPAADMHAVNAKTAYGAAISAKFDFTHADAVDPRVLNDILAHSRR